MNRIIRKISVLAVVLVSAASLMILAPENTYADCDTAILPSSWCDNQGGGIWGILRLVLTIMNGLVLIGAIIGIAIAAFLYTTAGGSEDKIKKSKDRILQAVIGLLVYGVLWAALQWLVPGGVN